MSILLVDSYKALASALFSKEEGVVGWPWPYGGTLGVPFSIRAYDGLVSASLLRGQGCGDCTSSL